MSDEIIHVVSEWPSYSQTFVRDDVEVSKAIFSKVSVFPLPLRELSLRAISRDSLLVFMHVPKMIYPLRKKCFRDLLLESCGKNFGFREFALLIYKVASAGILISKFDLGKRKNSVIIHAHFLSTGLEIAILTKSLNPNIRIFATGHGSDVLFNSSRKLNFFLRNTDVIIAASRVIKNRIESQMDPGILIMPTILLRYCRVPKVAQNLQSPFNKFESDEINILTVARFHPQKGLAIAVQAAKSLRDRDINFVWSIIGDEICAPRSKRS